MSPNISDSGIKTLVEHKDRINSVVDFISNTSPSDAKTVLAGMYLMFGTSDSAQAQLESPDVDPYDALDILTEVENAVEAAGIRVR